MLIMLCIVLFAVHVYYLFVFVCLFVSYLDCYLFLYLLACHLFIYLLLYIVLVKVFGLCEIGVVGDEVENCRILECCCCWWWWCLKLVKMMEWSFLQQLEKLIYFVFM